MRFVLLGAALFGLDAWRSRGVHSPNDTEIILSHDFVSGLADGLRRERGRAPTPAELDARVREFLRETVLYRHALSLGLDRGDVIVRRRLAQKAEYVLAADSEPGAPTEEQLQSWYREHSERYATAQRFTVEHRFFSRDRRGERARRDATPTDAGENGAGDPFVRGERFVSVTATELDAVFGDGFSLRVLALREGHWAGPVESVFGWHTVRWRSVSRSAEGVLGVDRLRERVERDWREAERLRQTERAIAELIARYTVVRR